MVNLGQPIVCQQKCGTLKRDVYSMTHNYGRILKSVQKCIEKKKCQGTKQTLNLEKLHIFGFLINPHTDHRWYKWGGWYYRWWLNVYIIKQLDHETYWQHIEKPIESEHGCRNVLLYDRGWTMFSKESETIQNKIELDSWVKIKSLKIPQSLSVPEVFYKSHVGI